MGEGEIKRSGETPHIQKTTTVQKKQGDFRELLSTAEGVNASFRPLIKSTGEHTMESMDAFEESKSYELNKAHHFDERIGGGTPDKVTETLNDVDRSARPIFKRKRAFESDAAALPPAKRPKKL